ncbi:hypothetical protein GGX14DRAFT_571062 [Mycena pura]|uniref:Uncharacterized protein n=1 Tax=Mycena pura TaxID=153505 RepID=A0AAD6YA61_9AGAR|nr:hypothetical protein GGX14DRAFT_571062 [Mycena pura]
MTKEGGKSGLRSKQLAFDARHSGWCRCLVTRTAPRIVKHPEPEPPEAGSRCPAPAPAHYCPVRTHAIAQAAALHHLALAHTHSTRAAATALRRPPLPLCAALCCCTLMQACVRGRAPPPALHTGSRRPAPAPFSTASCVRARWVSTPGAGVAPLAPPLPPCARAQVDVHTRTIFCAMRCPLSLDPRRRRCPPPCALVQARARAQPPRARLVSTPGAGAAPTAPCTGMFLTPTAAPALHRTIPRRHTRTHFDAPPPCGARGFFSTPRGYSVQSRYPKTRARALASKAARACA